MPVLHLVSGILIFAAGVLCAVPPGIQVKVGGSTVLGVKCEHSASNAFLGIPYATPPTGELRYSPPQPNKLSGIIHATKQPPNCLQFGAANIVPGPQSENCLFLNVFTPPNITQNSTLPVKAWIHGGGNSADSASDPLYTGCFIAEDAIIVSINYRLGPLGYLALESAGLEGNFGIQDQLLALQWIQDNIAAFGGDPTKVLLFGESAGAYDAFVLSTLPQASSRFSAVVTESGGGGDLPTFSQVQAHNHQFVKEFGCDPTDLACIRGLNTTAMNNTLIKEARKSPTVAVSLLTNDHTGISWSPVVNGKLIPKQPVTVGTHVPAIIGSNGNEGAIFLLSLGVPFSDCNETMYNTLIDYNFGTWAHSVKARYPVSAYKTKQFPTFSAMAAVLTDFYFKCPTYRALKGAAKNNVTTFSYRFNHIPHCSWLPVIPQNRLILDTLGPTHLSELPFVFGVTKNLPPPGGNCSFTPAEVEISKVLVNAWTAMADQKRPASSNRWPAWDLATSMGVVIDDLVRVGYQDYKACEFWDPITLNITDTSQTVNSTGI